MKAFKAKRIAYDIITGSYKEQYSLLREYAQELINQNPGPWPGQILTAVGVDANNGIYPVAYAIVEAESKASWCWFLNLLGEDLGIEANFNYTFISDRQKGLIQAIASVFPSAEHRYCVRHIHENMKSQFKGGVYKEMLWNAAKATSEGEFKKKMGELKSFNSDAYDWLMKIPLEQWSRAHFSGRAKCDLLINNICEVFNRQLVDGRDQPIITCLEYIREYLMKRIVVVQKVIAKTVGPLTPSVTKMPYKDQYVVNMDRRVSSCRKGKSVSCGKCGNVGHNRKGYSGQGGSFSQAGARKVSGQSASATNVSGQAAGARKVSGQAAGA
ncbi:mutator type transposase, partial [Tanacetum coccineum]